MEEAVQNQQSHESIEFVPAPAASPPGKASSDRVVYIVVAVVIAILTILQLIVLF